MYEAEALASLSMFLVKLLYFVTIAVMLILVPSTALMCAQTGKGVRDLGVSVLLVVALAIGGYFRYWP